MILNLISAVSANIWKYIFVDSISLLLGGLLNTLLIVLCAFPIGIFLGSLVGIAYYVPSKNIFIKIFKINILIHIKFNIIKGTRL